MLLQNLLVHDYVDATPLNTITGIRLSGTGGSSVTIRNTMIWNGDFAGIEGDAANDSLTIDNCSIDNITDPTDGGQYGINTSDTLNVLVRNTVVTRAGGRDFRVEIGSFSPSSTNNASQDLAGSGGAPGANALTGIAAAAVFVAPGSNLHLLGGANVAVNSGATLGFLTDIDGQLRPSGAWDRGADERDPTTEVELLSFEARPLDGAVELAWQTASELRNLGFHLHRSASASGPYERITSLLIPGAGSPVTGAHYSYLDPGLTNGTTYFYRLEDIDASSRSTFHGPVSAVPGTRAIPTPFLRLQRQGRPVAFRVEPPGSAFGPGGILYFFAEETASSTDYTPEIAYELVRGAGQPMQEVLASPAGAPAARASRAEASFETNRIYMPNLLEAPDIWLWQMATSGAAAPPSLAFSLAGVDSSSPEAAQLVVHLQGASESGAPIDHHVGVEINGVPAGETSFAGMRPHVLDVTVPVSTLREGTNDLSLSNRGDTGLVSRVFLDRFSVSYPQVPAARNGTLEGTTWSESGTGEVAGVGAAPVVLDVTPGATVKWLVGLEPAGGAVRFRVEAGRHYAVVSREALSVPRISRSGQSTLRDPGNQADYLLVAPREFLEAARPLVERRESQGLRARAVSLEEITDVFGYGRASAEAIHAFLAFAYHSWSPPSPRYVLLLGDSTYDPQRYLASSSPSPLPALWTKTRYLWTVSDPALAAVNGEDPIPDLAIGRLPARTRDEAETLVAKLLAWENSGQDLSGSAVLVADNPDEAGDFEANVEDVRTRFLAGRPTRVLRVRELGASTRSAVLEAFDDGASLVSYVGHGAAAVWASENVLNSWDVPNLLAQSRQPVLLTLDCLNGYFVAPSFDALAEALLKAEGRGTIAAFSPSGLSLDGPAHQYHLALVAELASGRHERLGDAALAAQQAYARSGLMPELLSIYHLLGDPATKIR